MSSRTIKALFLGLSLTVCISAFAQDRTVSQKDRQFNPKNMTVKVGDSIVFLNDDIVRHNVFSLSKTQSFDLGTFPPGESRKVQMLKEGIVEIECAIHPLMKLRIKVVR
jgi:plastocyanin